MSDIGTVRYIHTEYTLCKHCGAENSGLHVSRRGERGGVPISWVKRIEPPSELDDVKQDQEITA